MKTMLIILFIVNILLTVYCIDRNAVLSNEIAKIKMVQLTLQNKIRDLENQ